MKGIVDNNLRQMQIKITEKEREREREDTRQHF
jgi:hypothetical protein